MRKWILNLHLYAGLLCAPYLVIFGLSSLNFNHPVVSGKPAGPAREWQQSVPPPPTTDNLKTAEAIRDSLGMIGWTPWWLMSRDDAGDLRFAVEHPGRSYRIHFLATENRVRVEERAKPRLHVVNALHGLMKVPNSPFATAWGIYTDVCTWTVVFAALSGLYLWVRSKRERSAGAWILLTGIGSSIALMTYIVVRG